MIGTQKLSYLFFEKFNEGQPELNIFFESMTDALAKSQMITFGQTGL